MTRPSQPPNDQWSLLSAKLRGLAIALSGSEADADDLVQQTIANLLARRPDKATELAYARQALVNTWLDRQRSWRRRVTRLAAKARSQRSWHVDPDSTSDAELHAHVRRVVESLPPRQRAVLTMRTVEGLTDEVIAEALGCSREAVRSNMHLARRAVRSRIGDIS